MGVFTVGRQVALEIDMPGWWLANASVDMDFRRGLYYDSSTANPRAATDFLSCTRASVGYAKTSAGALTSFASNALRVTDLGLLVEDARTNSVVDSQDMTTANWNKGSSTVTADQAAAPDGTTTMDQVNEGTASSVEHIIYQTSTAFTANTDQTFSVFVKDVDRRYVWVALQSTGAAGKIFCIADLQTGTITDSGIPSGNGGTATALTSATIETFTNGIYRIRLTGKVNSSATQAFCVVALCDVSVQGSLSNGIAAYTGTNKSIYVWGAQLEKDVSFPSSYIPTTGAAATRAADQVTCIGNLSILLTALPHSAVFDVQRTTDVTTDFGNIISVLSTNPSLEMRNDANSIFWGSSGGNTNATLGGAVTWNGGAKAGFAQSSSANSIVGGGGTVVADVTQQVFTGTIYMAGLTSPRNIGLFRRATFWNSKLADATLQALTVP